MPLVVYVINEDINLDYKQEGNIISVNADNSYTDFNWSIEGEPLSEENSNSVQIDTDGWCEGIYNITCSAKKNGILYYSNIQIKKGGN